MIIPSVAPCEPVVCCLLSVAILVLSSSIQHKTTAYVLCTMYTRNSIPVLTLSQVSTDAYIFSVDRAGQTAILPAWVRLLHTL